MKQKDLIERTKKIKINKFTIVAIVLLIICAISLTPVTFQNDTYYTIKIGEHIKQNGIDMQDPFSWHEDLKYTYPHWAYDLVTYIIYNAFGFTGIYITTCILSSILAITIFLTNKKLTKNQIISFFVSIGAMYLLRSYIAARAQLVTFILFSLTIYYIEQFLETKKKRYAVGLIIIPIIIANAHTAVFPFYFILYLPYIAEYIIACLGERIVYRKKQQKKLKNKIKKIEKNQNEQEKLQELKEQLKTLEEKIDRIKIKRSKQLQDPYKIKLRKNNNVKWLILIMAICLLTGLLTPIGTTPYTYLFKTLQGNTTQNINEHLPLTLIKNTELMCTIIIFLSILIFTKAKIRLSDLFMLGGITFLMFSSARQISMFAVICSVILTRLVVELIEIYSKEDFEKIDKKISSKAGILILTIAICSLSYYFAKDKFDDKYVSTSTYPVDACNYILQNIDLSTARFFNEYNYGSYLLFRGIPVFIDSRADLYAPEFSGKKQDIFMDFINTSNIGTYYEDTFKKYNITHVILYKNSKINMIITKSKDNHYIQLYSDKKFVVYQRIPSE